MGQNGTEHLVCVCQFTNKCAIMVNGQNYLSDVIRSWNNWSTPGLSHASVCHVLPLGSSWDTVKILPQNVPRFIPQQSIFPHLIPETYHYHLASYELRCISPECPDGTPWRRYEIAIYVDIGLSIRVQDWKIPSAESIYRWKNPTKLVFHERNDILFWDQSFHPGTTSTIYKYTCRFMQWYLLLQIFLLSNFWFLGMIWNPRFVHGVYFHE